MQPNPHRSRLELGTWERFKSGWLIQLHSSSLPCESAWQPGGSCAPFQPHPQSGCLRSTAGQKWHCTQWTPLQRECHRPWGGAHLAVANWIKWEKSSSWYKCRTDTLKEKQQQSPPLYYGLCGHGSKTTLHSLEFSFERSCIKENNSTTILFKEKMKEEKKIFKLTLGSLFKRAWNYLNYTWKKKKKRKKNMPTRAEKSLQ